MEHPSQVVIAAVADAHRDVNAVFGQGRAHLGAGVADQIVAGLDAHIKLLAQQEHVLEDAKPAQAGRGDGALRMFRTSSMAARGVRRDSSDGSCDR